jgi:hypothetical protein
MSARPDELISEDEACRSLEINPQGLRAAAAQGLVNFVETDGGARGKVRLYYWGEIVKLKERISRLRDQLQVRQDEWPELIEVD